MSTRGLFWATFRHGGSLKGSLLNGSGVCAISQLHPDESDQIRFDPGSTVGVVDHHIFVLFLSANEGF